MEIKCDCGKLLARYTNEKLYLFCKRCKKEVEIDIKDILKAEPKSLD